MQPDPIPLFELVARDTDHLIDAWRRRFAASPLRLQGGTGGGLFALGEPIAQHLFEAGRDEPVALLPGAPALREVERAVAFAGGAAVSVEASGFDLAALVMSLRDSLAEAASPGARAQIQGFFEWLAIVALEAYASASRSQAHERSQGELERFTPVVVLPGELPAVFLVGSPSRATLDGVFARLSLLVARLGARAVLVDGTGLADPGTPGVLDAVARLLGHPELRRRLSFAACGIGDAAAERWAELADGEGARLEVFDRTDEALRHLAR